MKKRSPTLSHEERQRERDASLFAMMLLMPRDFLTRDFEQMCPDGIDIEHDERIVQLAKRYQVSTQLMLLRLIQLNLIPTDR
jgi:Zn-dependent peptidase ImmA (M78 family)